MDNHFFLNYLVKKETLGIGYIFIMILKILEEMQDQIVIAKHNIDKEPNTPTKYGIRGIPTMLLFKDGELKANKVGATTKSNIVSWIKENI